MEGGIRAWKGPVAEGMPQRALSFFASARSTQEYIALAWLLEEGTRSFYSAVSGMVAQSEAVRLFRDLSIAEEHHQAALTSLLVDLTGIRPDTDFPKAILSDLPSEGIMEGGMQMDDALLWAGGKQPRDILDFSMGLEANAYDRYLYMMDEVKDGQARHVFTVLSNEEKRHLERLTEAFEKEL